MGGRPKPVPDGFVRIGGKLYKITPCEECLLDFPARHGEGGSPPKYCSDRCYQRVKGRLQYRRNPGRWRRYRQERRAVEKRSTVVPTHSD